MTTMTDRAATVKRPVNRTLGLSKRFRVTGENTASPRCSCMIDSASLSHALQLELEDKPISSLPFQHLVRCAEIRAGSALPSCVQGSLHGTPTQWQDGADH